MSYGNSGSSGTGRFAGLPDTLDLTAGTPATDIAAGGGFVIEWDLDGISGGGNSNAQFKLVGGGGSFNESLWAGGSYAAGKGAGLYKFEFTITSGTWGTGSVETSVKAWRDAGSGWVEFTPATTGTWNTTAGTLNPRWEMWSQSSINMTLGSDLPGSTLGLNIYPLPEPATIAMLGLGSLVLLRKRR
jgi:hypothetical protein